MTCCRKCLVPLRPAPPASVARAFEVLLILYGDHRVNSIPGIDSPFTLLFRYAPTRERLDGYARILASIDIETMAAGIRQNRRAEPDDFAAALVMEILGHPIALADLDDCLSRMREDFESGLFVERIEDLVETVATANRLERLHHEAVCDASPLRSSVRHTCHFCYSELDLRKPIVVEFDAELGPPPCCPFCDGPIPKERLAPTPDNARKLAERLVGMLPINPRPRDLPDRMILFHSTSKADVDAWIDALRRIDVDALCTSLELSIDDASFPELAESARSGIAQLRLQHQTGLWAWRIADLRERVLTLQQLEAEHYRKVYTRRHGHPPNQRTDRISRSARQFEICMTP